MTILASIRQYHIKKGALSSSIENKVLFLRVLTFPEIYFLFVLFLKFYNILFFLCTYTYRLTSDDGLHSLYDDMVMNYNSNKLNNS